MTLLLSIYLTRRDDLTTSDDKIMVKKQADGNLQIEHYDATMKKTYNLTILADRLPTYVKDICRLYLNDGELVDPFMNIQFNFTGYPAFLINRQRLTDNFLRTLRSMAETVIDSVNMGVAPVEVDIPIESHSPRSSAFRTVFDENPRLYRTDSGCQRLPRTDSTWPDLTGYQRPARRCNSPPVESHY